MRAIQSAFPRMKDTIRFKGTDDQEHVEIKLETKLILKLMVLLYNFRLEKLGLNQIRNVYVPEWSNDARYLATGDFGN